MPEPENAFAFPVYVSAAGERVFVGDPVNRRVTAVRFEYAAEATCAVRQVRKEED